MSEYRPNPRISASLQTKTAAVKPGFSRGALAKNRHPTGGHPKGETSMTRSAPQQTHFCSHSGALAKNRTWTTSSGGRRCIHSTTRANDTRAPEWKKILLRLCGVSAPLRPASGFASRINFTSRTGRKRGRKRRTPVAYTGQTRNAKKKRDVRFVCLKEVVGH